MTRGYRNNNPGNIIKGGQPYLGEITPSKDARFRQFTQMAYGYRALMKLLVTYKNKYHLGTIRLMINRYAPPVENNTSAYVDTVSKRTGIAANDVIDVSDSTTMMKMAEAISFVENGTPGNMTDIAKAWELL